MNKIVIVMLDPSSINKQKQPNWNEPGTLENRKATQPNNAQPKNPEQTLTQEQKLNIEYSKRIMNGEKTNLSSQRYIEQRIVKTETNEINHYLIYQRMI